MNNKNLLNLSLFIILIFAFSFIKISFFAGHHKFFFSGINLVFPVLGALLGTTFSGIFVILFFLLKKITLGGVITLGLPTFFATLSFSIMTKNESTNKIKLYNFLLRVILPIFAIVLFVLNPIGKQAFIYSFYWFIPIGLYFFEKLTKYNSLFFKSLTVTFLAHSIGSLIWLYFIPTTSFYWISLISVVFVERFIFAVFISFTFKFIQSTWRMYNEVCKSFKLSKYIFYKI
ncbi:hypothetical protein GF385_00065 [Candidatus Dependentiae bacterium]|nr:hypothetical protein [Candidatus Dependentiae bacterium]